MFAQISLIAHTALTLESVPKKRTEKMQHFALGESQFQNTHTFQASDKRGKKGREAEK